MAIRNNKFFIVKITLKVLHYKTKQPIFVIVSNFYSFLRLLVLVRSIPLNVFNCAAARAMRKVNKKIITLDNSCRFNEKIRTIFSTKESLKLLRIVINTPKTFFAFTLLHLQNFSFLSEFNFKVQQFSWTKYTRSAD